MTRTVAPLGLQAAEMLPCIVSPNATHPQGSLEAALETASSLAAGEEDLQGDAALRDLLGGPSSLVPRAASLVRIHMLAFPPCSARGLPCAHTRAQRHPLPA